MSSEEKQTEEERHVSVEFEIKIPGKSGDVDRLLAFGGSPHSRNRYPDDPQLVKYGRVCFL